jgi:hypothetical protein
MLQTYIDGPYRAFTADVPANLIGMEGYLVEQTAIGTIQLYTATPMRPPVGTLFERLEGSNAWKVRLIGKGGTVRMVAGGAITLPAFVKANTGGTVIAASSTNAALGYAIVPDGGVAFTAAANDFIEVIDEPQIAA